MADGSVQVDYVDASSWNELVGEADAATPFHESKWLEAVAQHSGLRLCRTIASLGDGALLGLPLFVGRRGPIRVTLSPPPGYGIPYLGPISAGFAHMTESHRQGLIREYAAAINGSLFGGIANVVKLDVGPWFADLRPFLDLGFEAVPRYSYVLDLTPGFESLWARVHKSLRGDVKAAAPRYELREAQPSEMQWIVGAVHGRYIEQRRRLRTPSDFLALLFRDLPPERFRMFILGAEGVRVTGSIIVCFRGTMYGWLGVPRVPSRFRSANETLLCEILRWGVNHGYKTFDFVGANSPAIAHFKAKFNPDLQLCATLRRTPRPLRPFVHLRPGASG